MKQMSDVARFTAEADELLAEGDLDAALTHAAAAYGLAEDRPAGRAEAARALAAVHLAQGGVEAAGRYASEAVAAFDAEGRDEDPQLAEALHVSAMTHLHARDLAAATPLLERAAAVLDRVGPRHAFCSILLTLAEVSLALGQRDDAEGLLTRVLDDIQTITPASEAHAAHLNALNGKAFLGLGGLAVQRDERDEARDRLSRAVEFFEAAHGMAHPETVEALTEVAALYRVLGDEGAADAADEELSVAERMLAELDAASAIPRA